MSVDLPNLAGLKELGDTSTTSLRESKPLRVADHLRTPLLLAVLAVAINGFLVSILYVSLQPEIPLFYSLAQSEEQLAQKFWLFLLPGLGIALLTLHFIILRWLADLPQVMQRLFAWSTCIIEAMLLLASARIIWLVT